MLEINISSYNPLVDVVRVHNYVLRAYADTEFRANWMLLRVSQYIRTRSSIFSLKSFNSLFSQMASHAIVATPLYLTSMLDNVIICYFLLLHEIAPLLSENKDPYVDLRSVTFPTESVSVYPSSRIGAFFL